MLLVGALLATSIGAGEIAKSPADEWPNFRGNTAMTGVVGGDLPEKLELLWKFESVSSLDTPEPKDGKPAKREPSSFEASPAVDKDTVYVVDMDGHAYALDAATGAQRWQFTGEDAAGQKSSPCLAGEAIVYGDDFGVTRAIDRKTGKLVWKHQAEAEIISSPNYINGKVLIGCYDTHLYCLDAKDGKVVWDLAVEGPVHCSATMAGDMVAVVGCDGVFRLVNLADGKEAKKLEIGGNIASTPAVDGTRIFFGTMSNQVVAIDWQSMARLWTFEDKKRSFPFYSSPALVNDLVIIGGRDKTMHAFKQSDGSIAWAFRTRGKIEGSAVVVGQRVFFGGGDGNLYELDAATGTKKWDYEIGRPIVASPAVANGRLFIPGQDGFLYCFGQNPPP